MNVAEFDFELPPELIAQHPPEIRGASRLLVLDRHAQRIEDTTFDRLPAYLTSGDLLVLNDTRVFPARLLGRRVPSGGAVECLLLRQLPTSNSQFPTPHSQLPNGPVGSDGLGVGPSGGGSQESGVASSELGVGSWEWGVRDTCWEALVHPGQKLKPGSRVVFENADLRIHGEVLERHFHGRRTVRLWCDDGDLATAIDRLGHIPLPPYIRRDDTAADRDRYQTVYAQERGSIAAPTAGLHFTSELLERLAARGIERTSITLHVGYGTFQPVRVDRVEDHAVDPESFTVSPTTAEALTRARRQGRRVIAVGTTTTRALESLDLDAGGNVVPRTGATGLFIHPGHRFVLVDALITNFHLPRSSLLMLVASFAGRDATLAAYRHAVEQRYRFYSYGDAMLIL